MSGIIRNCYRKWFQDRSKSRPESRRRFHVPQVEVLEVRSLPSTFTVLNLADHGSGSLRAAILAAEAHPGADVIDFAKQVKGTIALTSGQIAITTDLTINGPGSDKVTVSGNDVSRVFDITGGANAGAAIHVGISGLTVAHGRASTAGGIRNRLFSNLALNDVSLTANEAVGLLGVIVSPNGGALQNSGIGAILRLDNCQVVGNAATVDPNGLLSSVGGAISNIGGGTVILSNSTVADNEVFGATSAAGGGIFSRGNLTLDHSFIADNQSQGGTGFGAEGGGVAAFSGSLTVNDSAITENLVACGAGGGEFYLFAIGGGIDVDGAVTATISNSTIASNDASGGSGLGVADGGGIDVRFGSASISDCFISDNRAVGSAGGGHSNGGGLLDVAAEVTVSNCTFTRNQAIGGDGGFDGQAIGGAIANYFGGDLSIADSTFEQNQAIAGNGAFLIDGFFADVAEGGAISNQYGAYLEVSHSTFRNNQALGGNNAVSTEANTPAAGGAEGGAIDNELGGVAFIHDSLIEHNQAIGGNGNMANEESGEFLPPLVGYGAGGGISNMFDDLGGYGPPQLIVINSTIEHNDAIGGNGNSGNGAMAFVGTGLGGGIANFLGGTADIDNTSLSHNRAVGGQGNVGSGGAAPASLGAGGAIFNGLGNFVVDPGTVLAPSIVNVSESILDHNEARGGTDQLGNGGDGWGGALANLFSATTNVAGSTLAYNHAQGGDGVAGGNGLGGGGFNDATSSLTLLASTVIQNHANGGQGDVGAGIGGGIYNLGLFTFDAFTVIHDNHASTSNDDFFG